MTSEKESDETTSPSQIISPGLIGRKVGMTRIFMDDGKSVPVTVLDVSGNKITQIKNEKSDGYDGIQIGFGKIKKNRLSKSLAGHFKKAGVDAFRLLKEFRPPQSFSKSDMPNVGDPVPVNIFKEGQLLDITGTTQGKGFQGAIKRHGFSSQRTTHGNSVSHRAPGSIGMCQDPGRVFKGKRMAGNMGTDTVTTQNLTVIRVDTNKQLLLIKGSIPGSKGSNVFLRPAKRISSLSSL